jgi:hypothetical protein
MKIHGDVYKDVVLQKIYSVRKTMLVERQCFVNALTGNRNYIAPFFLLICMP